MCEPATLTAGAIALGTALGGTALQMQGQQNADKAQGQTIAAETARQRQSADNTRAIAAQALTTATPEAVQATTDSASATRADALRDLSALPADQAGYLPGQTGGPQIVRDEVDRQRGLASVFTGQQADARARLGGWQDALFGARTGISRAGQGISQEASLARGSAGVLPMEMQGAAQAGARQRLYGDLVTAAGNIGAGTYGGTSGWGQLFSSAAPAAASIVSTPATRSGANGRLAGPV